MHIRKKKKEVEGSDPRKGREREKGQSEKECTIKRVKDRLDKQKKSQLHTRREQHKRDEKNTDEKNKMNFKSEKDREGGKSAFISFSLRGGRRSGTSTRTGRKHGKKEGKEGEKNEPGRRRVSEVGVIKPGVSSLQRHVHRLNQVPANQLHFHITSWTFA